MVCTTLALFGEKKTRVAALMVCLGAGLAAAAVARRPAPVVPTPVVPIGKSQAAESRVVMHNVVLYENGLRMQVKWLRGVIVPTRQNLSPSFDDPDSFALNIQDATASISLDDLAKAMNSSVLKRTALKDVTLSQSGKQLKVKGTVHKGVPLPVEILTDVSAAPDGRARIHISAIHVLKIPVKGLLKVFDIQTADVVDAKVGAGLEVKGDDIYIDPSQLLPSPRKRGKLTEVGLEGGNIVEFYGSARADIVKTSEWRNFVSIKGGSLQFGKLAMSNADIVMIDMSKDLWFDFDLMHYQNQLVNGTIRMTPEAGLRIFMPGANRVPASTSNQAIAALWLKNRNAAPADAAVP